MSHPQSTDSRDPSPAQALPDVMAQYEITHPDVVIVGGGPVGLWCAIQLQLRDPQKDIVVLERYAAYARKHVLRLDHWSLLLYGRQSKDARLQELYKDITGYGIGGVSVRVGTSVYIRTDVLEGILRKHALKLGVQWKLQSVDNLDHLTTLYPECRDIIVADGAHSKLRAELHQCYGSGGAAGVGDAGGDVKDRPMQYVVELKYHVPGVAGKLSSTHALTPKSVRDIPFLYAAYVGRPQENTTAITYRFFVDKQTYDAVGNVTFKNPGMLGADHMPEKLVRSANALLTERCRRFDERVDIRNIAVTKLILSSYRAHKWAYRADDRYYYLIGDAAMGVPYFRALNSGLIMASRLAQLMVPTYSKMTISRESQYGWYRFHQHLHWWTELGIAKVKNAGIGLIKRGRVYSALTNTGVIDTTDDSNLELCGPVQRP